MNRILPVRLRNLSSSHPIAYWIVNCIARGGRLGFLLVLFFILIGGICFFYDYVVGDEHMGGLSVALFCFQLSWLPDIPGAGSFSKLIITQYLVFLVFLIFLVSLFLMDY